MGKIVTILGKKMIGIVKEKDFSKEKLVVCDSCMFCLNGFTEHGSEQYQCRSRFRRILESACSQHKKTGIFTAGFLL